MLRRYWTRMGGVTDKKTSLRYLGTKERLSVVGSLVEDEVASIVFSFSFVCSSTAADIGRGSVSYSGFLLVRRGS